jgi:hypothetical protein
MEQRQAPLSCSPHRFFRFEKSQPKYPLHMIESAEVYYNVAVGLSLKLPEFLVFTRTRKA